MEALDLLQLHCPPPQIYYTPEMFKELDDMVKVGKLKNYGVSVEKVEEALKAIEYPGVRTVQIIFTCSGRDPPSSSSGRQNRDGSAYWPGFRLPAACSPGK